MIALDELKKLPLEDRWHIVGELTKSIEDEVDFEESPERIAELEKRHRDYLADPSQTIPWQAALRQIRSGRE